MNYLAEIRYKCGHYRINPVRSSRLAGIHHRDLPCPKCRAKQATDAQVRKIHSDIQRFNAAPRVFNDCGRDALEVANLRLTVRMGKEMSGEKTMYIGLPSKGAEIDQSDVEALIPYLQHFVKTGRLNDRS